MKTLEEIENELLNAQPSLSRNQPSSLNSSNHQVPQQVSKLISKPGREFHIIFIWLKFNIISFFVFKEDNQNTNIINQLQQHQQPQQTNQQQMELLKLIGMFNNNNNDNQQQKQLLFLQQQLLQQQQMQQAALLNAAAAAAAAATSGSNGVSNINQMNKLNEQQVQLLQQQQLSRLGMNLNNLCKYLLLLINIIFQYRLYSCNYFIKIF